jgi:hypothetical protein
MYPGWPITVLILLPNLLMLLLPPVAPAVQTDAPSGSKYRLMQVLERAGQAGVFSLPFFYRFSTGAPVSNAALAMMTCALLFYYAAWGRYALRGHRFELLYEPMLKVPLPMAVSPVVYFLAASVLVRSWPLALAALVLTVGHLYISHTERRRCSPVSLSAV